MTLSAGKSGRVWQGTIAQLETVGTDHSLAVGDPGIATDYLSGTQPIECLTAAAGSSTWGRKRRFEIIGGMSTGTAAERFFNLGGYGPAEASIAPAVGNEGHLRALKYATDVLAVEVRQDSDPGLTVIKLWQEAVAPAVASASETPSGADVWHVYTLTYSFDAGDIISVSQDPTNINTAISSLIIRCEETIPVTS